MFGSFSNEIVSICGYYTFFWVLRYLVIPSYMIPPDHVLGRPSEKFKQWKWMNITCSLIHSCISGFLALYLLVVDRSYSVDIINHQSRNMEILIALSSGYFIHDFADYISAGPKLFQAWDILLHHVVVILSCVLALTSKLYLPYIAIALLFECGTFCMHGLQLLRMKNVDLSGPMYKYGSLFTVLAYIVFRFGTLAFLTVWGVQYRDFIKQPYLSIMVAGVIIMWAMNFVLFYRLIKRDFFNKGKVAKQQ